MTVRQTLDINQLGYDYAASTAAVPGPAMVDRFTSKAIELPDAEHPFTRADLIFYGLDHSGASYEGQVFLGAPAESRSRRRILRSPGLRRLACSSFNHGGRLRAIRLAARSHEKRSLRLATAHP